MIKFDDGRLLRDLIKVDEQTKQLVSIDDILNSNIRKGFGTEDYFVSGNQRRIIHIHTTIQDYKKLSYDIYKKCESNNATLFYIDNETDLISLLGEQVFLSFAQKTGYIKSALVDMSLQVISTLSMLFSIFNFFISLYKDNPFSEKLPYILSIIGVTFSLFIILVIKYFREIQCHKAYSEVKETNIEDFTNKLKSFKTNKLHFSVENILIVENIQKLDQYVQAFLLYYLTQPTNGNQIWCILNDETKELQITNIHINDYLEEYYLCPFSLEDKKEIIYQLGINHYKQELLGTLGVDSLFIEQLGYIEEYEYSDSLTQKIHELLNGEKDGKSYLKAVYCLTYLMVKLGYFMTLQNMISLICNEHDNKQNFIQLEKQCKTDIGAEHFEMSQFEEFLRKLIDILDYYCIADTNKNIRFSTNFFKCLETEFNALLPSKNTTKKWILVKLLCNQDKFDEENYFLDCCNLLPQIEFKDISTELMVSLRLLDALNKNYCWLYYPIMLNHLDHLTQNTDMRTKYLQSDVVKNAIINYRLFIADENSIQFHRNYLAEYCQIFKSKYIEHIPMSKLGILNFNTDENKKFYKNMMCLKDPTAYYYYLIGQWMQIITNPLPVSVPQQILDISWEYPISEPVALIFDLFKILILYMTDDKSELLQAQHYDLNRIGELLHAKKYYSTQIMEKITHELNQIFNVKSDGVEIRLLFLGTAIENTNSIHLRFFFNIFKYITNNGIENYNFKNSELNLLYRYNIFKNNVYQNGISDYIKLIITSNFSIDTCIKMLIYLLIIGTPNADTIIQYLNNQKDSLIHELCLWCKYITDIQTLEDILLEIYILSLNLNTVTLSEEITNQIEKVLAKQSNNDYQSIFSIFRFIMLDDSFELGRENNEIIKTTNELLNHEFALAYFQRHYKKNKDIIFELPKIKRINIFYEYNTTLFPSLVGDYLKKCAIDNVDYNLLFFYLDYMDRYNSYNSINIINTYLYVIDRYDKKFQLKHEHYEQYCNYQAQLMYMISSIFKENFLNEVTENYLLQTTLKLIQLLSQIEDYHALKNKYDTFDFSSRTDEADNYILEHIKDIKANYLLDTFFLNATYVEIINYLIKFPECYTMLIDNLGKQRVELILNSNLIQLLKMYIKHLNSENNYVAISYLLKVMTVLKNYNQILQRMEGGGEFSPTFLGLF